jgi:hypothetical protein
MKTVNSLSGGKTSSYLAVHYPADIEIFALCCIDAHNAGASIDPKIKQMVNDKLQKFSPNYPEFVATSEDPQVLTTMFDLEQKLGREIIWVRGSGWEEMIKLKKAIPNMQKRFCTSILKIQPIFEYLFRYHELPVKMRMGFRFDEEHRQNHENQFFKYSASQKFSPHGYSIDAVTGRFTDGKWRNKWENIKWRINEYPLIVDQITHYQISKYWENENLVFPADSNCLNCFWKQPQQLRKNFDTNLPIMVWASIMENIHGYTFKDDYSLEQISRLPKQLDFVFGTGSGCNAGFCHD